MNKSIFERFKTQLHSKEFKDGLIVLILIGILSMVIMTITFIFSSATLNLPLFQSYFMGKWLMLMNIIPIFLLMVFLSLMFNSLWVSFSLTSIVFFVMSVVNKYKLVYRDEPLIFRDISLLTESLNMAKKYKISLNFEMIVILIILIAIIIVLKKFVPFRLISNKVRILFLTIIVVVGVIIFKDLYFNTAIYQRVGNKDLINIWSETQQFQSRGLVYPFFYSITDLGDRQLEGYDEVKAKKLLNEKEYTNIHEDQKINVIAIMLESYNDFSKFEDVVLPIDIYENFHSIQNESYTGGLVTNVFAGGTINTEWSFLTGYNSHPKYDKNTNTFVRYFKEQGYSTEAMHPNYGWFYNRRNVNEYIGFDNFDYYENKYESINKDFLEDNDFFDYILVGYEESKDSKSPYFNFSVTYQNHGPYSVHKLTDIEYLKKKADYDEITYNIINNYFSGIKKTDEAIKKLIDYFEKEDEPTVVIFFGDHNPWLGENASGYEMLGINLDLSTEDGFLNYYETPYVFWGNQAAKAALNRDFVGKGTEISPNFLMAELFEYLGWEGNEYMQYILNVKQQFSVNHDMYFNDNGQYTPKLNEEKSQIWKNFNSVQYYYSRNLKK